METGRPAATHCLDCGGTLVVGQEFCGHCGQRADLGRLTWHEVGHELMHAVVHADRSILSLIVSLLVRPGVVAREYVAGKRRRHFGPFSTLLVMLGITALLSELAGFESITSSEPLTGLQNFLNRHVDLLVLPQIPMLGAFCWLIFRRDRFSFVEHMVLVAYAVALRAILFIFLVLPWWYVAHPGAGLIGDAIWSLWSIYFGIAASQFYSGNRLLSGLKGAIAAALVVPVTSALINAVVRAYQHLGGV